MKTNSRLIEVTPRGLYCSPGDFYIDPWKRVDRAIITHAHADHARPGSASYLCAESGVGLLSLRIGSKAVVKGLPFERKTRLKDTWVSLHPAGHILGSSQVRIEFRGEVWVVSGDYKTEMDPSCETFKPVPCHTFITESTFALPVYTWPDSAEVFREIRRWWKNNQAAGRTSVLFAYSLGKAQRILSGLEKPPGPIGVHSSVSPYLPIYESAGVRFAASRPVLKDNGSDFAGKGLIIAPGSVRNSTWLQRFGDVSLAFASGWMLVSKGRGRQSALDRGFVISDHADWNGLLSAVNATGAESVGVTHGYADIFARYLKEKCGLDTFVVPERFNG